MLRLLHLSSLSYDLNYRLTSISSAVQNLGMGYDANSNVVSIADQLDATRNQSFTYDALERLRTAAGSYGGRGYGYDAVSNRTGESFSIGAETGMTAYAYPANANRLLNISGDETRAFTYDATGNLLTDTAANDDDRKNYDGNRGWRGHGHKYGHDKNKHGNKPKDIESRAFTYDSRNRNIAITTRDGRGREIKTARYAYNAMGQRVAKDGVHFIYDLSGNLIAERTSGGWKDYIYIDSMPVAMIDNNNVYYIHTDHLASPQKVTDPRQKIVWERVAEPFGETMQILGPVVESRDRGTQPPKRGPATVTLNLRFPGQYHDEETGLDYNYFRTYDPSIGRYTQSDPIGLAGGLNTYGYVDQNPVNFIDPLGLTKARCEGRGYLPGCKDQLLEGGGGRGGYTYGPSISGGKTGGGGGVSTPVKSTPAPPKVCEPAGPHTVFKTDPTTGKVSHYETRVPQTNPQNPNPWQREKSYDATGRSHFNKETQQYVNTPHIHDPKTPGGVRVPNPEEIPK